MLSCPKFLTSYKNHASGQVLIMVILLTFALTILATAFFASSAQFSKFSSRATEVDQAINLAEAGIDYAAWKQFDGAGISNDCNNPTTETLNSNAHFEVCYDEGNSTFISTGLIGPDINNPIKSQIISMGVEEIPLESPFLYSAIALEGDVIFGDPNTDGGTINGDIWSNEDVFSALNSRTPRNLNGDAYYNGSFSSNIVHNGTKFNWAGTYTPIPLDVDKWKRAACSLDPDDETKIPEPPPAGDCITYQDCGGFCLINGNQGPKLFIGNVLLTCSGSNRETTVEGTIYIQDGFFGIGTCGNYIRKSPTIFDSDESTYIFVEGEPGSVEETKVIDLSCGGSGFCNTSVQGYLSFYAINGSIWVAKNPQAALWAPNGFVQFTHPFSNISGCVMGKNVQIKNQSILTWAPICKDLKFKYSNNVLPGIGLGKGTYKYE